MLKRRFLTGIVDANGRPWRTNSTGEPYCVIVYEFEDDVGGVVEAARYVLAAGDSFLMAEVTCIVRSVEPANNQIQIEAAGVTYTIRVEGSFSEFANE